MNEQEQIKTMLNQYIIDTGTKSRFICQKLGIDEPYFCRFRKGTKYLGEEHLNKLKNYLESNIRH